MGHVPADAALIARLTSLVGDKHVLTDPNRTRQYRTGYRFGTGPVLVVVRPGTLVEQWKVLEVCVAANKIIIMQAANTGLTGGSTPNGDGYDREIIIINTLRLSKVYPIRDGHQVVCLAGATLNKLEDAVRPYGREPHSVIGSSCIGASVIGGICNNSGGSLVRRGPAYTQMALFARIDEIGRLELVNHLGFDDGDDPLTVLDRLDRGDFNDADFLDLAGLAASDHDYASHVRDVDATTPARYNADPRRLFEASGSAGKVALFAVRVDTFPRDVDPRVFYIGTSDPDELTSIRRHMLAEFATLPVSAEYLHRDAFDIAERYGKDIFLAVRHLGTDRLPVLFALKARFDGLVSRLGFAPAGLGDRVMQSLARFFPDHLPRRMKAFRDRFEHHLLLKMPGSGVAEAQAYLRSILPSASGAFFECTHDEGTKAFLHRFAVAGAAVRYRALHPETVEDIVALDVALKRNDRIWFEQLPVDVDRSIDHKLYYGHFFCHVFHHDYVIAKGQDARAIEHRILKLVAARGAECPAEHNVGHLYAAPPDLAAHYRALDPSNSFNPGIGQTSRLARWN